MCREDLLELKSLLSVTVLLPFSVLRSWLELRESPSGGPAIQPGAYHLVIQ